MKLKLIIVCFFLAILLSGSACKNEKQPAREIEFTGLVKKSVEITKNKTLEGYYIVSDPFNSEIYTDRILKTKRKYLIRILDSTSWDVLREIELPAGDFKSPTEYYNPTYIERLGDRYYVVDQFEKIVVYDLDFNHLYSSMHHQVRNFIDILKIRNETMFTLGTKHVSTTMISKIQLFRLTKDKRPELVDNLSGEYITHSIHGKNNGPQMYVGQFWASTSGFEQDGKIYHACGDRRELEIYDIATKKKIFINLSYLKGKKYSSDDANKLGYYKTDGWEEEHLKKYGEPVYYDPYPDKMYHFGIYKIGKNKIGIAAAVDLEKMTFRLDVIDSVKWSYLYSIELPAGFGFRRTLTTWHRGLKKGYINIDTGLFVGRDEIKSDEEDEYVSVTRLIRFKVK